MKTYILMKNDSTPDNAEDIKVDDIYGIYQNRCKAFWECKVANLKIASQTNTKSPKILKSYVLKEINLESNEILNSYYLDGRNKILDENDNTYKIPVFYQDIENEYNEIVNA